MGAAFFYHLTDSTVEATLMMLLPRALERGWRVEIRGRDGAEMERLDAALWKGPKEGFLPHGLAGGEHDALQPVLLTHGQAAANAPTCVMSVQGADVSAAEVSAAERVCILFNGLEDGAVETARNQWRGLTGAGCSAEYWAREDGRWQKKAEA